MFLRYKARKKNGKERRYHSLVENRRAASQGRLYRHWFEHSAMADPLGADLELAEIHKLYECHERLLEHQQELFTHLAGRWRDLFNARFEILHYDLTSTYFESDPPFPEGDKRPDCALVVVALIVTPEGFPLAYEVQVSDLCAQSSGRSPAGAILTSLGSN